MWTERPDAGILEEDFLGVDSRGTLVRPHTSRVVPSNRPPWALPPKRHTLWGQQTNIRPGDWFTAGDRIAGLPPTAFLVGFEVGLWEWQAPPPNRWTFNSRLPPGTPLSDGAISMPLEGCIFLPRLDQLMWMLSRWDGSAHTCFTDTSKKWISPQGNETAMPSMVELLQRADKQLALQGCPARRMS